MKKSTFRKERERHLRDFEGLSTPTVIHLRLERAVEDAEAAGVTWDPEEPELPRELVLLDVGRLRIAITEEPRWWVAEGVVGGSLNPAYPGRDWQKRVLGAAVAAYNREREEEAFDAEHGEEFSAAVEEVCKGEVDALVARKVQEERDRWLATEQGTTHAPDYKARSEESEGALHRLAREAGVPDDGPAEIAGAVLEEMRRLRCYEALSLRTIKKERDRCLAILDELVKQLQSPFPYQAAKRARSRVASGAQPEPAWTGADDLPDKEPAERWPASWYLLQAFKADGNAAYFLSAAHATETARRWEAEPRLQAEVERLKGFAAFALSEENARLRDRIEHARAYMLRVWPNIDKEHAYAHLPNHKELYRILTGKES